MNSSSSEYGISDNSYKAAGELAGITRLVDDFYDNMSTFPEAKIIRDMHSSDLTESRKKTSLFFIRLVRWPKDICRHLWQPEYSRSAPAFARR